VGKRGRAGPGWVLGWGQARSVSTAGHRSGERPTGGYHHLTRCAPPTRHGRARRLAACWSSLLAVIVLIPGQDRRVLGVELLLGGVLVALSVRLQSRTLGRLGGGQRLEWAARILPFNLATLAVPVAGASLLAGHFGGLYWLTPIVLISLLRSVLNAWTLLVRVAEPRLTPWPPLH